MRNGKRTNLKFAMFHRGTNLLFGDKIQRGDSIIEYFGQSGMKLKKDDKIIRNGSTITPTFTRKKEFHLLVGDIVERQLKNGDVVLLNRQPTLHKGSMMAQEIIIRPFKTFRFNLSINKSFNADFDGDEMNIHVPQSYESRAELMNLSMSKYMMMSAQSSKNTICIVQDSLLGSYMMTKDVSKISKDNFFNVCMSGINTDGTSWSPSYILDRIQHIQVILKKFGKNIPVFSPKNLFSMILPSDFNYSNKNGVLQDEPVVKIYKGVLYEGAINKNDIGQSHNSIIQLLHKEYDHDVASTFIDNVQFITNAYLTIVGVTVGIKDCIPQKEDEIQAVVERCMIEAKGVEGTTHHPGIREMRVTAALNKARDVGLRIAKNSLQPDNNFISTVTSGSKGDFFNIAQITGLLGQQNLVGQRVAPHLNHGKRTLPHYPRTNMSKELEFESRGFIRHSFIHGLNPQEFYFHAMSGREGVTDTAMGTSTTGYDQRRIVKTTEDLQVRNDGTVRNTEGHIYQFVYGEDGLDTSQAIYHKGDIEVCNVGRLVERLNMKYVSPCEQP